MKTCILTTTINVPTLLRDYAANVREYGHKEVEFVVVGDRKTPPQAAELCAHLEKEFGSRFTYFDVPRQQDYLRRFPDLDRLIPWNSIQRRNVGLLYALEQGHENVISIDDDNFLVTGCDFVGEHIKGLGTPSNQKVADTTTGWFNCVAMMQTNFGTVYPRGFPLSKRWQKENWTITDTVRRPVVNAGLWSGDPDIDALTRIYYPVEASQPLSHDYLSLDSGCWCPINTQNTAFHRLAAPLSFVIVMGYEINGIRMARYDDIWMSWLLRAVMDRFGDTVRFGKPVVHQNRNQHNLFRDLRDELPAMELNEPLIEACRSAKLTASTYLGCYRQLAAHIRQNLTGHPQAAFFKHFSDQMLIWTEAAESVCPTRSEAQAINPISAK